MIILFVILLQIYSYPYNMKMNMNISIHIDIIIDFSIPQVSKLQMRKSQKQIYTPSVLSHTISQSQGKHVIYKFFQRAGHCINDMGPWAPHGAQIFYYIFNVIMLYLKHILCSTFIFSYNILILATTCYS